MKHAQLVHLASAIVDFSTNQDRLILHYDAALASGNDAALEKFIQRFGHEVSFAHPELTEALRRFQGSARDGYARRLMGASAA